MRRLVLAWLALTGASMGVAQAAEPAPEQVLRECAQTAPAGHRGLDRLRQDCPALDAALASLGLAGALATGEDDRLEPASLASLAELLRGPTGREPDVAALAPVLRELAGDEAPESWWSRFKRWFQELAGGDPGGTPLPRWLLRWLQGLSPGEALVRGLVLALEIAVVLLALFVAWRELRAAGVLGGAGRNRGEAPAAPWPEDAAQAVAPPRAIEAAGLRPRALFRLVAGRLVASRRLPAERSLTHRELSLAARLEEPVRQAAWTRLADLAEREAYAPEPGETSGLDEAARVLLAAQDGDREGGPRA